MLFRTTTFHGDNDITITGIPGTNVGPTEQIAPPPTPDSYKIDFPGTSVTLSSADFQCLYWALTAAINLTNVSYL